ncbi:vascular endothelial growth factor receptor 3-like [Copidosoma floridanum]|uniref:vascular endothelial growth factor receptor 3-like n=1 Tax=Copidosoma floridanum TaxID=29053 RepID=UPI000C6FBEB4|nr:vascular endothelial growth factor receptor 3-like [Copidosoma floridanum]
MWLISLLMYFYLQTKHAKFKEKQLLKAGDTYFKEGAVDLINPELTIDEQAELLPYDIRWEFPIEKLRLDKQLGSGAFGVVYKAEAYRILPHESITTVAVKTVRKNAGLMYISALAKELKIMVYLGQHLNVINLLGACTKNIAKRKNLKRTRPEIYENLTMALSDSSPNDKHTIHYSETSKFSGPIESSDDLMNEDSEPGWRSNYDGDYTEEDFSFLCTEDLLLWAYQVANGMKFLSERKVLHCDLAARNILLAENNIVKICDFGLAKTLYKDENHKKQCDGKLPIGWMAIESIRDGVFSTMSDVWSFGVVLWEFFSLVQIPYSGVGHNIMLHCWEEEPTSRPSCTMLVEIIGKLLQNNTKTHFLRIYHNYGNFDKERQLEKKDDNQATASFSEDMIIPLYWHRNLLLRVKLTKVHAYVIYLDIKADERSNSAEYKSMVMLRPQAESTIKCMACNSYGCNDIKYDIHITGQNISLVCSAVIREFYPISWSVDKRYEIVDSGQFYTEVMIKVIKT